MTSADTIRTTALNATHRLLGARMVEFGGYDMPVWYSSIIKEHTAVREAAGLFDLSHMGELFFKGPEAEGELQRLTANNVGKLGIGDAQYSFLPNLTGGIVDDIVLYRLGEQAYLMVVNASNIAKDVAWLTSQLKDPAVMTDRSEEMSLLAVQGPRATEVVSKVLANPEAAVALKSYTFVTENLPGAQADLGHVIVSRTGYTGEDGFEIYVPNELAEEWWAKLMKAGAGFIEPCGLGARDTLRLELCYSLYGHEITDETNPFEANLGWVTKLQKGDFLGSDVLGRIKEEGLTRKMVGLYPEGKRPVRQGAKVFVDGTAAGFVTSGSFSPTLERNVALAYVPIGQAEVGSTVELEIGEGRVPAHVVETPFVKAWNKR